MFQSPQWGSNSKGANELCKKLELIEFQSPQWGSNSKDSYAKKRRYRYWFQSPQWGSNSKGGNWRSSFCGCEVSVPAMGK